MKTSTIPVTDPAWFIVDAEGQTIGRIAAKIAHVLRGKHKVSFSPHQLCGDHIIVTNIEKLKISPMKGLKKLYYDHTGYPGHLQTRRLDKVMQDNPSEVIERAVKGMLPGNRLRPLMLKRLHVLKGSEHKYAAQKPVPLTFDL